MRTPPLNTLKAFEAAARLSSLTAASRELNLTHSAVSQQIKALEAWLGIRLFDRMGRGIVPTSAGVEFHEAVAAALNIIATAGRRVGRDRDNGLTVCCIPSIATRWLIPAVQDFLARFPTIDLRVQYAHALEAFAPEKHDVLITLSRPERENCRSVKIFSRMNKPVASALYLKQRPEILKPGGLEAADLLHDETTEGWEEWFRKAGRTRTRPPRGPVFQDFNLLTGAIMAGHGVALCPIEVFRREILQGDLVVLSDIATEEDEGYYLLRSEMTHPLVDAFSDWFQKICARPQKPDNEKRRVPDRHRKPGGR